MRGIKAGTAGGVSFVFLFGSDFKIILEKISNLTRLSAVCQNVPLPVLAQKQISSFTNENCKLS